MMSSETDVNEAVTGEDSPDPVAPPPPASGDIDHAHDDDAVDTLRAERDDYLAALQRTQAEFENYRKRTERDRSVAAARERADVWRTLLPLLDALDAARDHEPAAVAPLWSTAVEALARSGVEPIDPHAGEEFDPQFHDAVATTGAADAPVVADVLRPGYRLGGVVLRPAQVAVIEREDTTTSKE